MSFTVAAERGDGEAIQGANVRASTLIATLAVGATIAQADAEVSFVGRWYQMASQGRCSVVQGFELETDGTASVDWIELQAGEHGTNLHSVVGHRDGTWTSTGGMLHLVVTDVVSDPATLQRLGRTDPISTEIDVDGSMVGPKRIEALITDNRDRNIDGRPYKIRCTYLRD